MFAVRRIFLNRKTLSNCISTSSRVQCGKSKKSNTASDTQEGEENSDSKKAASKEEQRYENLFSASTKAKKVKPRKNIESTSKPQKEQKPKEASGAKFRNDIFKRVLVSSVEKVAENLGGNKMETQKDLLDYVRTFQVTKEPPKQAENVIEQILPDPSTLKPLFQGSEGLNIFHPKIKERMNDQVQLNIWDTLEVEDLEYNSLTSPRNHFEELIQWTNEGKLWRFPIDNDQGLEEEAKVSFTEHIFLEQYLEPWCPKKGPLRKFMELVLIGLSKNPYLTVEDKKEHINWFQNYFENKKKLLQELGAMGATKEIDV